MKSKIRFLISLLIAHYSLLTCSYAVEIHPNAGTTSASFLKLGIGSRAMAMGSAFAGLADDSTALYWNPAGLAQMKWQEIHITHNESFESIRHDYVGYATPLSKGALAVALYGLYTPKDIERRSGLNEADPYEPLTPIEGYFQAYDLAAHVSYARLLKKNLSAGASLKFIQQVIDDRSAYGAALDLGMLYHFETRPLSLGFVIQHLGTPIQFISKSYPLPVNFKLGAAYKWNSKIVSTLDLNKSIDNFLFVSAGAEYNPWDILSIRFGYRYRWYGNELGDLSGVSAGIGFNYKFNNLKCRFDYAFIPFAALGESHRISVSIMFGGALQQAEAQHSAKTQLSRKKPIPATEAVLPPQPEIMTSLTVNNTGYSFYPVKTSAKLKMASGRMTVFAVKGESVQSDLTYFEATIRGHNPANLNIEIGEKQGEGNIYKYFMFRNNVSANIQRAMCRIKLPKDIKSFIIETEDGYEIKIEKISEDEKYCYYQFNLDKLSPFRIEKR